MGSSAMYDLPKAIARLEQHDAHVSPPPTITTNLAHCSDPVCQMLSAHPPSIPSLPAVPCCAVLHDRCDMGTVLTGASSTGEGMLVHGHHVLCQLLEVGVAVLLGQGRRLGHHLQHAR